MVHVLTDFNLVYPSMKLVGSFYLTDVLGFSQTSSVARLADLKVVSVNSGLWLGTEFEFVDQTQVLIDEIGHVEVSRP